MLKIYITIGMLYTLYILIGSIILMNQGKESMFNIEGEHDITETVFVRLLVYTCTAFILVYTWPIGLFLGIRKLLSKVKSN